MRLPVQLEGNVLPTVLVVGTLMLLAVLALLGLSDIERTLSYGYHTRKQQQAWLDAAMLLCERDSTLWGRLNETGAFVLFGDDPRSEVTLSRGMWGLYELIKGSADDGKIREARLMGCVAESPKRAALYVCDNQRAFTLAGKSNIKGTIYLPESGLLYGQVQSDFYSGERLPEQQIRRASERFPSLSLAIVSALKELFAEINTTGAMVVDELQNGFFEPPIRLRAENLSGVRLYGHILIGSTERIVIDSTARLEDVLIVAPEVIIREGFSGSLQIIATDTVRIERHVRLKYPSGIVVAEGTADSYVEIAENSEVNGYMVFRTASETPPEKRTPHYLQQESSRVRGLVWVDGIAQVHGIVTGSLYVNQANYYSPQGYYMNLLYNASIYRSEAMPFPLWMQSDYQRKTAKWLD